MASSYYNFTGKARFIKHIFSPEEFMGASKYKAGIWLDEVNQAKFYESGIQAGFQQKEKGGDPTKLKEDEFGPYVVFSRDDAKLIKKKLVYFAPPYIKNKDLSYRVQYVDEDGNQVRQYEDYNKKPIREGEPFLIGNNSIVELNVCVFDTVTKGKGHRLEGIRILDLIEYHPTDGNVNSVNYTPSTSGETDKEVEKEVEEKFPTKPKKKPAF